MRRLLLAATALATSVLSQPALAQSVDPPARVGFISRVTGTVSYRLGDDPAWRPATVNLPVTTGTSLWTEPGAGADVGVGGTHLAMNGQTELDITRLDDHEMDVTEPQGDLCLHPVAVARGDTYVVQTPRGTVQITASGRYEVVAGDTAMPTSVTVLDGTALVTGPTFNLALGANQTATVDGDGASTPFRTSLGAARRSAFLDACLARERPPSPNRPAVVAQMTGSEVLDAYGSWEATPDYGAVWFPQDAPDYVPFRTGYWTDVAPWGWTWVDAAPWGFAPSHYGRWVEVRDRWGWVAAERRAGVYGRPVYAPAVVAFLGGAAFRADADRPVSWVPLGPGEPYYPPYRVSRGYVRNINETHVRNVEDVVQNYNTTVVNAGTLPPMRSFANGRAATVAPAAAVAGGQQIGPVARPVAPDALQQAALARPPAGAGRVPFTPSPGPAVTGAPAGVRPPLRRLGAEPGQPGTPAPRAPVPGSPPAAGPGAFPQLREPGAGRPVGPGNAAAPAASEPRPAPATPPGIPGAPVPVPAGESRPGEAPARSGEPQPLNPALRERERPGLPDVGRTPEPTLPGEPRVGETGQTVEPPRPEQPRVGEPPRTAAPTAVPVPRPAEQPRPEVSHPPEPPRPAAPPQAPQPQLAAPPPRPEPFRAVGPRPAEPLARPAPPPQAPPPRAEPLARPVPEARPPPPQAHPPPAPPPPRPAPPSPRPAAPPPRPAAPPEARPAARPPPPAPRRPGEPG